LHRTIRVAGNQNSIERASLAGWPCVVRLSGGGSFIDTGRRAVYLFNGIPCLNKFYFRRILYFEDIAERAVLIWSCGITLERYNLREFLTYRRFVSTSNYPGKKKAKQNRA
jgi:hypothetical protein